MISLVVNIDFVIYFVATMDKVNVLSFSNFEIFRLAIWVGVGFFQNCLFGEGLLNNWK